MSTPITEADRLFPLLLSRAQSLAEHYGQPEAIPLSIYETDYDLHILRPEDGGAWTAEFHHRVMIELAARLQKQGFPARLIEMDAAAYLRWLDAEKRTNSPEARAQFISLQSR